MLAFVPMSNDCVYIYIYILWFLYNMANDHPFHIGPPYNRYVNPYQSIDDQANIIWVYNHPTFDQGTFRVIITAYLQDPEGVKTSSFAPSPFVHLVAQDFLLTHAPKRTPRASQVSQKQTPRLAIFGGSWWFSMFSWWFLGGIMVSLWF